jgi:hypothetical protein
VIVEPGGDAILPGRQLPMFGARIGAVDAARFAASGSEMMTTKMAVIARFIRIGSR